MTPFWQTKTLAQMTPQEWESLCDGCAKCCLHKLQDEEDGEVYYTDVACRYLNLTSARCNAYGDRLTNVPECVALTPDNIQDMPWLPDTCAYKLLHQGQALPAWHPLIAKNSIKMQKKGVSVLGRVVSETWVSPDQYEERVIYWVNSFIT